MNYVGEVDPLLRAIGDLGVVALEDIANHKAEEMLESVLDLHVKLLEQAYIMFYYLRRSLETIPGSPDMLRSRNNYLMEGIAHDLYNVYLGDCGCRVVWFDGCLFRND